MENNYSHANSIKYADKLADDIMNIIDNIKYSSNRGIQQGGTDNYLVNSDEMLDNINNIIDTIPQQKGGEKQKYFLNKIRKYNKLYENKQFTSELSENIIKNKIKKYEYKYNQIGGGYTIASILAMKINAIMGETDIENLKEMKNTIIGNITDTTDQANLDSKLAWIIYSIDQLTHDNPKTHALAALQQEQEQQEESGYLIKEDTSFNSDKITGKLNEITKFLEKNYITLTDTDDDKSQYYNRDRLSKKFITVIELVKEKTERTEKEKTERIEKEKTEKEKTEKTEKTFNKIKHYLTRLQKFFPDIQDFVITNLESTTKSTQEYNKTIIGYLFDCFVQNYKNNKNNKNSADKLKLLEINFIILMCLSILQEELNT